MKKAVFAGALAALLPALAAAQPAGQPAGQPRALPHTVHGELKLFQEVNYNGEAWDIDSASPTVHTDWNIRSVAIHPGDRWQICARSRFRDPCIVLDRSVNDTSLVGIDGQIGSARPAPQPAAPAQ